MIMRGRLFVNEFLKSRCNISRAEASSPFFVRSLNLMTTKSSNLEWLKTNDRKTETKTGKKAKKRGGSTNIYQIYIYPYLKQMISKPREGLFPRENSILRHRRARVKYFTSECRT